MQKVFCPYLVHQPKVQLLQETIDMLNGKLYKIEQQVRGKVAWPTAKQYT